jgi:hypothetical protein
MGDPDAARPLSDRRDRLVSPWGLASCDVLPVAPKSPASFIDERQAAAVSELIGHGLEGGHEFSAQ